MAGSRDVSTTGHAGDKSFPWYWDVGARGAIHRSDGPDEFRRAVREEIKQGAEIIKMFVTGGHGTVAPSERTEMTPRRARRRASRRPTSAARWCAATSPTARRSTWRSMPASTSSTTATGSTTQAIERMVELGTFLVPSQLFPARFAEMMGGARPRVHARTWRPTSSGRSPSCRRPTPPGSGCSAATTTAPISLPHGRYADELEFYVKEAGIPPLDVIRWATRNGVELMGRGHELGSVREGYLADLLVVDGDPLRDIGVLQDQARLLAIMKGGTLIKDELAPGAPGDGGTLAP